MWRFNDLDGTSRQTRVAVVAAGIVTPLCVGLDDTSSSLQGATDCVAPVTGFDVSQCRCKTAGQISDARLLARRSEGKKRARLHRASEMMITAFDELRQLDLQFNPELTVIGSKCVGHLLCQTYYRSLHQHRCISQS